MPKDIVRKNATRKYDSNITLIKSVTCKDELCPNQFFALMKVGDWVEGERIENGLDTCAGRIVISKHFEAIWLPFKSMKMFIVEVIDPKICFMM